MPCLLQLPAYRLSTFVGGRASACPGQAGHPLLSIPTAAVAPEQWRGEHESVTVDVNVPALKLYSSKPARNFLVKFAAPIHLPELRSFHATP